MPGLYRKKEERLRNSEDNNRERFENVFVQHSLGIFVERMNNSSEMNLYINTQIEVTPSNT